MSQDHAFFQTQIQSDHPLTPEEQASLDHHLKNCAECRAYAALHGHLNQALAGLYPAFNSETDIQAKARLLQSIYEKKRRNSEMMQHIFSFSLVAAMVGVLLLVIALLPQIISRPTMLIGKSLPSNTPTPTQAPTQTRTTTPTIPTPPRQTEILESPPGAFPTQPGATWTYIETDYTQGKGSPDKTLDGISRIEERILEATSVPPYTILHIQGSKVMLSANQGWQESNAPGFENYAYWLVLTDHRIYLTTIQPDPERIDIGTMRLEYVFPLTPGSDWCANNNTTSSCPANRRVQKTDGDPSPIGELNDCLDIHETANNVELITRFCDGIGVTGVKYAHSSIGFQMEQQLVAFTDGKNGRQQITQDSQYQHWLQASALPNLSANTTISSVAMEQGLAYIGIANRLAILDIQQPEAPQMLALSPELPGDVRKIITLPNTAPPRVVVSAGRYLAVLEATGPGELRLVTQSKLPGPINALILDIVGSRLYAGGALNSDNTKGYLVVLDTTPSDHLELLTTLQIDAPVLGLAMANQQLYMLHSSPTPRVALVTLQQGDQFGAPQNLFYSGQPFYSIATAGDRLYLGSEGHLMIFQVSAPSQQETTWGVRQLNDIRQPGTVLGLALREKVIYTAGVSPVGIRFQYINQLNEAIQAGSIVDSASYISVGYGLMLVSGEPLEIFDTLDSGQLTLLGTFPNDKSTP